MDFVVPDRLEVPDRLGQKQTQRAGVISPTSKTEEMRMTKTLAVLATVAAIGATAVTAPKAEARGFGPGLGFALAAGAIAYGAYGPYGPYYGPRYYGYYGPRYYGPGPYAYYGGPYYAHRYY